MSKAMRRALARLAAALILLCLPVDLATAQTSPSPADAASRQLDTIAASVTEIESGLHGRDISDADLQALRGRGRAMAKRVDRRLLLIPSAGP